MKILVIIMLSSILFSGCLVFNRINYKVTIDSKAKGTAEVTIYDIRSDAKTNKDLQDDRKNLFTFLLESEDFKTGMEAEGKNIQHREFIVNGDTLIGKATYKFEDISNVESLAYEDGFYFLTLQPEDSVIYTNGEIIITADHKRILWDDSYKTLEFEMLGNTFEDGSFRSLAQFYQEEN